MKLVRRVDGQRLNRAHLSCANSHICGKSKQFLALGLLSQYILWFLSAASPYMCVRYGVEFVQQVCILSCNKAMHSVLPTMKRVLMYCVRRLAYMYFNGGVKLEVLMYCVRRLVPYMYFNGGVKLEVVSYDVSEFDRIAAYRDSPQRRCRSIANANPHYKWTLFQRKKVRSSLSTGMAKVGTCSSQAVYSSNTLLSTINKPVMPIKKDRDCVANSEGCGVAMLIGNQQFHSEENDDLLRGRKRLGATQQKRSEQQSSSLNGDAHSAADPEPAEMVLSLCAKLTGEFLHYVTGTHRNALAVIIRSKWLSNKTTTTLATCGSSVTSPEIDCTTATRSREGIRESWSFSERPSFVNNGGESNDKGVIIACETEKSHYHQNSSPISICNEIETEPVADYLHTEQYDIAVEMFQCARNHSCSRTTHPCHAVMVAEFVCGFASLKLSNLVTAAKHFHEYLRLAIMFQRDDDIALAHTFLGDICSLNEEHVNSASHYLHATNGPEKHQICDLLRLKTPTLSSLYLKLGHAFKHDSQMLKAIDAYKYAIHLAGNDNEKLVGHTTLGNLLQSMGEYFGALVQYKESIRLSEKINDGISLAWSLGNIGNAYLGLHENDKSLYHLKLSLELTLVHEPTPEAIGRAYNNLGTAYQSLNELDKAKEYYKCALDQAIYGQDVKSQARALGNLGNLFMLQKDYTKAIVHYSDALQLSNDRLIVSAGNHNRGCAYYEQAETVTINESNKHHALILYSLAAQDLDSALQMYEEMFKSIRGNLKSLTLSASLLESNSRTFHKLQECLVRMNEIERALAVAEQCRGRTLVEVFMKKRQDKLNVRDEQTLPLNVMQIKSIICSIDCPAMYLSYTGTNLIIWLLVNTNREVTISHRVIDTKRLESEKFCGKTFDFFVQQNLKNVDKSLALFGNDNNMAFVLSTLFDIIIDPLHSLLNEAKLLSTTKLIVIPDSYTSSIPFSALHPKENPHKAVGSTCCVQIMPSISMMGYLSHHETTIVSDSFPACVVGNPDIPTFTLNGEEVILGTLPHATREARWISHTLRTTPLLHDQATKAAVVKSMLKAKIIHIATHGSAVSGFVAFSGGGSFAKQTDAKDILLLAKDVEKLDIHPLLVVLSSCDSGSGTIQADGVNSMARAFLLAGAQSVLTTLWRIPDESAEVFMQFFYQYMMDGLSSFQALQRATQSVKCLEKYSGCIHWGGYQMYGRELRLQQQLSTKEKTLKETLGSSYAFPQLDIVQILVAALITSPTSPSNVQILKGCHGMKCSDPVRSFINAFHHHFKGGILWINCTCSHIIEASVERAQKILGFEVSPMNYGSILIVLDNMSNWPDLSSSTAGQFLLGLMKDVRAHVVCVSSIDLATVAEVSTNITVLLSRGYEFIDVPPLSLIHTAQRVIHACMNQKELDPFKEKAALEKLVYFSRGSPTIVSILTSKSMQERCNHTLNELVKELEAIINVHERGFNYKDYAVKLYEASFPSAWPEQYDLWKGVAALLYISNLAPHEELFLCCLAAFAGAPILDYVLERLAHLIYQSHQSTKTVSYKDTRDKLIGFKLINKYPEPVILHPQPRERQVGQSCYRVTSAVSSALWSCKMNDGDRIMALSLLFKLLEDLYRNRACLTLIDLQSIAGLAEIAKCSYDCYFHLIEKDCYEEFCGLFLKFKTAVKYAF